MSDFAARVVRMRTERRVEPEVPSVDLSGSPETIASEHIVLAGPGDVQRIGAPRASSLYKSCVRKHVIGTHLGLQSTKRLTINHRLTFGLGEAVHRWVQNDPTVFGDRRRGWWKCRACNRVLYFGAPPKREGCRHCHALPGALEYHEYELGLKADGITVVTGHPDMFIMRAQMLRVVEVKTIEGEAFKALKAPLIDHLWQTQLYMWGCNLDTRFPATLDQTVGFVLYISKKWTSGSLPFKMFPVHENSNLLDRIKQKLAEYVRGVKDYPNEVPVVQSSCISTRWTCYDARTCPALTECRRLAREEERQ